MKKRLLVLLGVLVLAAAMTTVAFAGGKSNVVYTWTIADLGQGIWGGGPLFADGSAGGNFAFSGEDGQLIFHLHPQNWSEVVPGVSVNICYDVHEIKGDSGFSSPFCLTDVVGPFGIPILGTPIIMPNPVDPDLNVLIRVTPAN